MKKNDTSKVFVVGDKNMYFYKFEENCAYPLYIKNRILDNFSYLLDRLNLAMPKIFINKHLLEASDVIFTDSGFRKCVYKTLIKQKSNMKLYYMNPIDNQNKELLHYFTEVYSFSETDSNEYGMKYKHTPYSKAKNINMSKEKYDVVFLGRVKGREEEILSTKKILENAGITCRFMVFGADSNEIVLKEYMDYETYLGYVLNCKCVLEMNQKGQDACSLRFLEGLFYEKKVITNNINIVNDLYYDKENVFILGENDISVLYEFINGSYKRVCGLEKIEFKNWLQSFGE